MSKIESIKKLQGDRNVKKEATKVFGYTRVSTDEQANNGKSLEEQRTKIESWCEKNGYVCSRIFTDEGISGSCRTRPGLLDLVNSLEKSMIVACTDIDRMSRDLLYLLTIKEQIHEKKCHIHFINRDMDTSKIENQLLLQIMGAFSEQERNMIRQRVKNVMQDMSRKGTLRKKPKFGWRYNENKELVEHEEEQLIIELLREKADEGLKMCQIIRFLDGNNITIRKCKKIYPRSIQNIMDANGIVLKINK